MQLFFDENLDLTTSEHLIEADESKHILRVLRKKIGDTIYLTNGKGEACKAEIMAVISKRCKVKILETFQEAAPEYHLHIAMAPTKSADRFEHFLEKSTEIGVSEITPIICQNNERKKLNLARCQKIIQSAMKQSQRFYLPKFNNLTNFQSFIENDFKTNDKFIAHCEDLQKHEFKHQASTSLRVLILIGPEGDFSSDEIKIALQKDYKPVSLGHKRLRTETAGIVASAMMAFR
jgi:16S rRNA (uracil1498-N3)-methyltransferase